MLSRAKNGVCIADTRKVYKKSKKSITYNNALINSTAVKPARHSTRIFLEADGKRRFSDFLFKEIFLVEKQNDGSVCEPLVVTD